MNRLKRLICLFCGLIALQVAHAYDFSAEAPTGQTLYYDIFNGEAMVVCPDLDDYSGPDDYGHCWLNYTKPTNALTIPSEVSYGGITYSVFKIERYAFLGCDELTSVTIPTTVIIIDELAFFGCSGLTTITIPNSVEFIYRNAFSECNGLTSVQFNADSCYCFDYYDGAPFNGCPNITSFTFGNNVKAIPNYLCNDMSGLTSITIPNSVRYIGEGSFMGCSGLTSVTIPNSVISIERFAFDDCNGLTSVQFNADSCTYGGIEIFDDCPSITSFTFGNNVKAIPAHLCQGISGLTSITIPNSVKFIGDGAFSGCSGLTAVIIPNSVMSIGTYAFSECSGLTSVQFNADSCIAAGTYDNYHTDRVVFKTCPNISSFNFGGNVKIIPSFLCYEMSGLTSITIPNSVTDIGRYAFYGCTGLTSVTIPNSVESIGMHAFSQCYGLTSVQFNADSCVNSSHQPVFGESSITDFTFGSNVKLIPDCICYGMSGLTSTTIPQNVTSIGSDAFKNCYGLTSVVFNADSCTHAGYTSQRAFEGCGNISNFMFGNNVKVIPGHLCDGLSGLASVVIPATVGHIGEYAFASCSALDTVFMSSAIPPTLGTGAFAGNSNSRVFILTGCSYDDYYNNSSWVTYGWYLRNPIIDINITVNTNNADMGDAGIHQLHGNDVRCDSTVVVYASSDYNHFDHWSNGSTANPDTLHLTGDSTVTAIFIGLTTLSSNGNRGQAYHYKLGDHIEQIVANAANDYYFGHWSNSSTANPETITLTGDSTVTAYFYGLTALSDNESQGTTASTKIADGRAKITATAKYGYHFDHWSNGSTVNPDTLHIMSDSIVTAYFARNAYSLTATVADAALGSVVLPGGSSPLYGDTALVVAQPIAHHHVVSWTGDGIVATSARKDSVWVVMLTDRSVGCTIAIDTHTVNVASGNFVRGMVSASGSEFVYGTPCTVTATAYTGYTFSHWSNGVTANPYTFAVLEDMDLTAIFLSPDEQTFTVSVGSASPAMGSASVNGQTSYSAQSGEVVTFVAISNAGYRFSHWQDGDTTNPRTITVAADTAFVAHFEAIPPAQYTVSVSSASPAMGSTTGGGTYTEGETAVLTATPAEGYRFSHWQDGDTTNPRTITVAADTAFVAHFEAVTQGIDDVEASGIKVWSQQGSIVFEGCDGCEVQIYDIAGRRMENRALPTGIYMVRIGHHTPQKVVVVL